MKKVFMIVDVARCEDCNNCLLSCLPLQRHLVEWSPQPPAEVHFLRRI